MDNFIDSYLVGLGFSVDEASAAKLKNVMASAEATITQHTTGIGKRMVEFQLGVFGAFTSVSAAILGVVENAAMADQRFRLLGETMLMSTEQARKMSMITSSLGASLGQIRWDKEL